MNKKILGIICAMVVLTGCSKSPKISNGEEVVASIDGRDFTANELYDNMKNQYGTSMLINMIDSYIADTEIGESEDANIYADSYISQIKLQYEQSGMDFNEALVNAGYENEEAFKKIIVSDYKMNEVTENYLKDELTDKEIEKYYKDKISAEINVKHILIIPDVAEGVSDQAKTEAEDAAYEKAKELIKKLDEGADFDTLAKENSDDTATASNGGVINNVTKEGYVTEFYNAAYALEDGKYTATPIKSQYGYHIIYRVSMNEKKSLDELRDSIKDTLVQEKLSNNTNLQVITWDKIRSKYNLNIIDTNIKNTYNTTISNVK